MAAMAFVTRPWHVVALRAGLGLFTGYGALALAMAAESAPRQRMTSAIGFVQTAQRLGPALGPAIGGVLASWLGLRLSFVVAAGFYLAALWLVVKLYSEGSAAHDSAVPAAPRRVGYRTVLGFENIPMLMAVIFAITFVERSVGPILALYLEQTGVGAERVAFTAGLLFSLAAIAGAFGHHVCSHLLQRFRAAQVLVASALVIAAGAGLYALGTGAWTMGAAAACIGFGSGIASTAAYSSAGAVIPHESRGQGFGMITGAALVGLAISPMVAGFMGSTTLRGVFVLDLVIMAVVVVGLRRWMPWTRPA
jgi:DHA1 family multidrug resistance protein-like MFS transporter